MQTQYPQVALLIYPSFTEFEIAVATQLLYHRFKVIAVAPQAALLTSETGMQVLPHFSLGEVEPTDFAALIVAAAPDMQTILEDQHVLEFIRAMDRAKRIIAAICGAPMLLARAGILRERLYTVSLYKRYRELLGFFDERYYRNEPVIEDENLITAQGYAYAEFGLHLAQRLDAMQDEEAAMAYYRGQGDIRGED